MSNDFAPLQPASVWTPSVGDIVECCRRHWGEHGEPVETWARGKVLHVVNPSTMAGRRYIVAGDSVSDSFALDQLREIKP